MLIPADLRRHYLKIKPMVITNAVAHWDLLNIIVGRLEEALCPGYRIILHFISLGIVAFAHAYDSLRAQIFEHFD